MNSATEPVFVNGYGDQESILINRFRQPMQPAGPVRQLGLSYGPTGWELIPGLLQRFTNPGSGVHVLCTVAGTSLQRWHYTNVPAVIWHHLLLQARRLLSAYVGSTAAVMRLKFTSNIPECCSD